jgi:uncharacterized membrane-anchored protein YhcB (DUF1043 family)
MQEAHYYREQAERAQRLAHAVNHLETAALLSRMARDYHEIAEDLETGAVEIRHPELLPQKQA